MSTTTDDTALKLKSSIVLKAAAQSDSSDSGRNYSARAGETIAGNLGRSSTGQFIRVGTESQAASDERKKKVLANAANAIAGAKKAGKGGAGGGKGKGKAAGKGGKGKAEKKTPADPAIIIDKIAGEGVTEALFVVAEEDPTSKLNAEYEEKLLKAGLITKDPITGDVVLSTQGKALMAASEAGDEKAANLALRRGGRMARRQEMLDTARAENKAEQEAAKKKKADEVAARKAEQEAKSITKKLASEQAKKAKLQEREQARQAKLSKPTGGSGGASEPKSQPEPEQPVEKPVKPATSQPTEADLARREEQALLQQASSPKLLQELEEDGTLEALSFMRDDPTTELKPEFEAALTKRGFLVKAGTGKKSELTDAGNALLKAATTGNLKAAQRAARKGIRSVRRSSTATTKEAGALTETTLKHLPGKHDQSSHAGLFRKLIKTRMDNDGMNRRDARNAVAREVLSRPNASSQERAIARRMLPKDERPPVERKPRSSVGTASKPKAGNSNSNNNKTSPKSATTKAFGSDPNRTYEFKHRVVDLDDLITSNNDNGTVNPAYTAELQPRMREREASKRQVEKIAKTFVPESALWDFHQLDKGPAIIGSDMMVESGNGRTLAMRKMRELFPEKWKEYQAKLRQSLEAAGLSESDLKGVRNPVLVRERVSQVDRAQFAKEANSPPVLQMSALEQALVDSKQISDVSLQRFEVSDDQTIDQALRSPKNRSFVQNFVGMLSEPERAPLMRGDGSLSQQGLWRIKAAVFTKVFPGEAGTRLADTFLESLDGNIKNFESAISASMPKLALADSLVNGGRRSKDLSITEDLSRAIDMLARLKEHGPSVEDYLGQGSMFGKELTPFQESLLSYFNDIGRSPKKIREFMQGYADAVIDAPEEGQGSLFGDDFGTPQLTKESIVMRLIGRSVNEPALAGAGSKEAKRSMRVVPPLKKKGLVPVADSLVAALTWTSTAPTETYDEVVRELAERPRRMKETVIASVVSGNAAKTKTETEQVAPKHTSIMIGFWLPSEAAQKLAIPESVAAKLPNGFEVLPQSELHITVGYLGKVHTDANTDREQLDRLKVEVISAITKFVSTQHPFPVAGVYNGVGLFASEGNQKALYYSFDSPGMSKFRYMLVKTLRDCGIIVTENHGFIPHTTVCYMPSNAATVPVELITTVPADVEVRFNEIVLAWGDEQIKFPLLSLEAQAELKNSYALQIMTNLELARHAAEQRGEDEIVIWRDDETGRTITAPASLTVFKEATTGKYRWVMRSATAFKDRDGEFISRAALNKAVARMEAKKLSGLAVDNGPLRWWHVTADDSVDASKSIGFDIGRCDLSIVIDRVLLETGTFDNPAVGQALAESVKEHGDLSASVGYRHLKTEPDAENTYHDMDIFERSLLPDWIASNEVAGGLTTLISNNN